MIDHHPTPQRNRCARRGAPAVGATQGGGVEHGRAAREMTDFEAFLLSFAERYPAGAGGDGMGRRGRRAGYPACCVEFYAVLIPVLWRGASPELDAWWQADPGHGYVRCPRCRSQQPNAQGRQVQGRTLRKLGLDGPV
jgi:hypothetical protein